MPPRTRTLHPNTQALLDRLRGSLAASEVPTPVVTTVVTPAVTPEPFQLTPFVPKPYKPKYSPKPVQSTQGVFAFAAPPPPALKAPASAKVTAPPRKATAVAAAPDLSDIIVLDTETTGIGTYARLVEVAAVHVKNGVEVRRFQSLVNPEMHIPAMVVRVHGITDAMVANSPTAGPVLAALAKFVAGHTLVAHNAGFDFGILSREFARVKQPTPGCGMYCSVRLARVVFPEAPRHGLGALTSFLKLSHQPAHRAVADVLTTIEMLNVAAARKKSHQAVRLVGRRYEL